MTEFPGYSMHVDLLVLRGACGLARLDLDVRHREQLFRRAYRCAIVFIAKSRAGWCH